MKWLKNLLIVLFVLIIPFITILGAFRLTAFNMYFYEGQFNKYEPDVENPIELTVSTLIFLKDTSASRDLISEYTVEEQVHLIEVREVIGGFLFYLYAAIIAAVIILVILFLMDRKDFLLNQGVALFYGGWLSAIFISLFLFSIFVGFDSAFIYFHNALFTSVWRFPANSLLIRLFPKIFFVDVIVKIVIGAYVSSMFFNVAGFFMVKKEKYIKKVKRSKK